MNKTLICGAVLGFLSVAMGAFADHGLALTPDQEESMATAIRYNMLSAVLIVALSLAPPEKKLRLPALLFILGTNVFCASIYAAILLGIPSLTLATPFGGLTLMAGWVSLIWAGVRVSCHHTGTFEK